eukprot:gene9169-3769_t
MAAPTQLGGGATFLTQCAALMSALGDAAAEYLREMSSGLLGGFAELGVRNDALYRRAADAATRLVRLEQPRRKVGEADEQLEVCVCDLAGLLEHDCGARPGSAAALLSLFARLDGEGLP